MSYVKAPRQVRASKHTTHFQAFGLSERIYWGDPRHDDNMKSSPLTPVRARPNLITYRQINGEMVRV